MGALVIGITLSGAIFGRFFKWPVLIPACGLATALVMANAGRMEHSLLGLFLHVVMVNTGVQFGYVLAGLPALSSLRPKIQSAPVPAAGTHRADPR